MNSGEWTGKKSFFRSYYPLTTIHQQPGIEADTPSKPYISPHFRNSVNFVAFNRLRRDRVKTTIVLFRPPIFYLSARRVLA